MANKPTYEELEQRVKELERDALSRKKDEEVLENSEENIKRQARLLDLIFEHSLDSIVLLDKDYNFIRVSETYAKACQRESTEFPGHNHFKFYPSDFKDEVDEAKKGKYIYKKSARPFVFPDHPELGTTYWNIGLVPILDKEGEIELFLFTLKDITGQVQAEEALRESERKYRKISENVPAVVYQFKMTPDGVFSLPYVNDTVESIMGVTVEDAMRDSSAIMNMTHPEDKKILLEGIMNSAETLETYHEIFRILKDGEVLWLECRAMPNLMTDGNILWDGFFIDITDRKQAEEELIKIHGELEIRIKKRTEELAKSEQMFKIAFKHSLNAMVISTLQEEKYKIVNPAFTTLLGYSEAETIGYTPQELNIFKNPSDREIIKKEIVAKGYIERLELYLRAKSGEEIVGLFSAKIIEIDNEKCILTTIVDITEHKFILGSLLKSEKELQVKTSNLKKINTALNILLKKRGEDKEKLEEHILSNLNTLVEPYLDRLNNSTVDQTQKALLDIIQSNINEITLPFSRKLSSEYFDLTPREIQIANLIKNGKTSKEIAELLKVTSAAASFHRGNIRKKFGLTNKKTNLKTFLDSFKE